MQLGDACSSDVQCQSHNGQCINDVCQCGVNSTMEGGIGNKYCRIQCGLDQVTYNNQCYPRLKLGASCQPGSTQCPQNAYCNSNSVCACRCEYDAVGDTICGPPQVCKQRLQNGSSTATTRKSGSATFCKLPSTAHTVPAVDECPAGDICTSYMADVGLCCPIPSS